MRIWQILFTSASELLLLVNVVLCLIFFKRVKIFKYFTSLMIFSFLIQVIAHIIWFQHETNQQANNLYLLHFYTLVEFILLTLFYHQFFKESLLWGKYIYWFIGVITLLIVANSIFLQPITVFNSNAKTLSQVIIIVYAVSFFFFNVMQKPNFNKGINLINATVLLYYAGSLFIFMLSNVFLVLEPRHSLVWILNALLYLIFQLLVFIAIWQFRQTKSIYS